MEQPIRCPVCDHISSHHFGTGRESAKHLRMCRCKFNADTVLERATAVVVTYWAKRLDR
jgi:hypothetical protein